MPFDGTVGPGEAVRISTGAEVPDGADAILRKEDADDRGDAVAATVPPPAGMSLRRRGEDVREGQVLLPAGHRVAPHEVGVVAAAGHAVVSCLRRPRVVIVGSGDELVQPGGRPGPGQVFDSNRHGIAAQARAAGAEVLGLVLVPDDRAATEEALREALDGDRPDLLVTIGGVSVGRHDHLRPALEASGVAQVFFGAAHPPRPPAVAGRARPSNACWGSPGTRCRRPSASTRSGASCSGWPTTGTCGCPSGRPTGRTRRGPSSSAAARMDGALHPLPRQGSHAITSLASASHLAVIPAEHDETPAGERLRTSRLS